MEDKEIITWELVPVEEMIWKLTDLDRPARVAEARAITVALRAAVAAKIEAVRREEA